MCAFDLLRVFFAYLMLLGREMSLVGPPAVGVKLRDTKRRQPLLELQEDVVLAPAEDICQDFPRVMINGVPQPAGVRFAAYVTPHFVQLGGEPSTVLQFLRAADLHLYLLRI